MSFAHSAYRAARFETAGRVAIVVELYAGAIRFLRSAIEHDSAKQLAERGKCLSKAHAIISELQVTLDPEKAPELSDQLNQLYDFILDRITQANLQKDMKLLEPAINVLETLKSAWSELAAKGM